MTTKSPRFAEINPATNKVWKLAEMHAALLEARVQLEEAKCETDKYLLMALHSDETELTWGDIQKRFIMPGVRRDRKERPLFWQDARCGYRSLINAIKEGYAELRKPLFITN